MSYRCFVNAKMFINSVSLSGCNYNIFCCISLYIGLCGLLIKPPSMHLQATLSKLLTYGVLRSTQPPTLRGTGNK